MGFVEDTCYLLSNLLPTTTQKPGYCSIDFMDKETGSKEGRNQLPEAAELIVVDLGSKALSDSKVSFSRTNSCPSAMIPPEK